MSVQLTSWHRLPFFDCEKSHFVIMFFHLHNISRIWHHLTSSCMIFWHLRSAPILIVNCTVKNKGTSTLHYLCSTLFYKGNLESELVIVWIPTKWKGVLVKAGRSQDYFGLDLSSTSWEPMDKANWIVITTGHLKRLYSYRDIGYLGPEKDTCRQDSLTTRIDWYQSPPTSVFIR